MELNAFHITGVALAAWAVVLAFAGIRSASFPSTRGAERMVVVVSVILVAAAIASAIVTGAQEAAHDGERAAATLPGG